MLGARWRDCATDLWVAVGFFAAEFAVAGSLARASAAPTIETAARNTSAQRKTHAPRVCLLVLSAGRGLFIQARGPGIDTLDRAFSLAPEMADGPRQRDDEVANRGTRKT